MNNYKYFDNVAKNSCDGLPWRCVGALAFCACWRNNHVFYAPTCDVWLYTLQTGVFPSFISDTKWCNINWPANHILPDLTKSFRVIPATYSSGSGRLFLHNFKQRRRDRSHDQIINLKIISLHVTFYSRTSYQLPDLLHFPYPMQYHP